MKHLLHIGLVDDDLMYSSIINKRLNEVEDYSLTHFPDAASFFRYNINELDILILDHFLPDSNGIEILKRIKDFKKEIPVIFVSGQTELGVVIEAYNAGASNYLIKNENVYVELDNAIRNHYETIGLRKEVELLKESVINRSKYTEIIGESNVILRVIHLLEKLERSNILALITGESGTGKDLVAKAIHYNSTRARKPFIAVNMAAIPADLVESELFGHEKGAFTGADSKRIGKFEEADSGSIFLDEIGEMDIHLQTKLLRVLQEGKITRLGSNKEIKLDVRVIAATNQKLHQRVKDGKFREDLYYRLQGFIIQMPSLRSRGNDIILLANHFLRQFANDQKLPVKALSKDAITAMMKHKWPGNVRELRSFIERSLLISEGNIITTDDLIFAENTWD